MDAGFNKALKKLVEDIFACFLQADYENNLYLYEHRIHDSKNQCISHILKCTKSEETNRALAIYDSIIDCGLLRWRVKDKSAFSICRTEMEGVRDAFIELLSPRPAGAGPREEHLLIGKIAALESLNQSVLQVAAKEPLAFLLFISGLKTLQETYFAIPDFASA